MTTLALLKICAAGCLAPFLALMFLLAVCRIAGLASAREEGRQP